jgi:hypothetical protein
MKLTVERRDNDQQNVDQKTGIKLKRWDNAKKSHDESTQYTELKEHGDSDS